jgi:Ca-activated chloride channel family protein
MFAERIRQVSTRGSTAIHDGVMEGAREVRKSRDARRLNRVVLLSDGQANVGPRNPADFARLGHELLGEGISVSTIGLGLGYNEDLMLQLARASDGNHAFANAPNDLIQIFNREFDDVLAACAQTVSIDVEVGSGVKLTRALSREGDVQGDRAAFKMNQIYAATEHYVLLELEVEGATPADERDLGRVHVSYTVPDTGAREVIEAPIRGRFSASAVAVVEQTARARAQEAVKLRDEGKHTEAAKLFQQNVEEIQTVQGTLAQPSKALDGLQRQYDTFSKTTPVAPASQLMMERKALRQMDSGNNTGGARY